MAHKDYTQVRDQQFPRRPNLDLNGDGMGDPIIQGYLSKATCDKIKGCAIVDDYACAPNLKHGSDDPVPFSKAPPRLSRLFGNAAAFVFTQSTLPSRTLRFFPDDPDGGVRENPASFSVGQVAGYFSPAGKFVSFKIDGFAVGLYKAGVVGDTHLEPARDKAGQALRIAYGKGPDGKPIEKPLAELIWASPDGKQAIDPQILVAGGTTKRPLSEAETELLPLFKRAQDIALKYKKLQQKETGPSDLSHVRLTSPEIRRQARKEMQEMARELYPYNLAGNFALWDGVRIAIGKVAGLKRVDLVLYTIQE